MRKKIYLKDVVIYAVIICAIVWVACLYFKDIKTDLMTKVLTFIGAIVTILFGFLGIIDFAYNNGLKILVPHSYEHYKEESAKKTIAHYTEEFFKNEVDYYTQYNDARLTYLLNQLGLDRNQFDILKKEMLKIRLMPMRDLKDAEEKMKRLLGTANIIVSQTGRPSDELVYKDVKNYINLVNVMFDDAYRKQILDCLAKLIQEKEKTDNITFDRVAVSNKGNFLLGVGISEKLNKALIRVTQDPTIFTNENWIGNFPKDVNNKTVFVHDVLVSGSQIVDSIKAINKHTMVKAVFCLVKRIEHGGEKKIKDEFPDMKIYSLLDLNEDDLEKIMNGTV